MKFKLITCCPFLLKIENSETIIDSILEVWKNLTRRAYSYYRMAAMSYLQYLQLNGKVSTHPIILWYFFLELYDYHSIYTLLHLFVDFKWR